jgi:hypothetical protein
LFWVHKHVAGSTGKASFCAAHGASGSPFLYHVSMAYCTRRSSRAFCILLVLLLLLLLQSWRRNCFRALRVRHGRMRDQGGLGVGSGDYTSPLVLLPPQIVTGFLNSVPRTPLRGPTISPSSLLYNDDDNISHFHKILWASWCTNGRCKLSSN